ncbi:hypothetical protein [Aestuariispira insulae]|uniref:Uncharacterized protein n=1 Tax=Aestuariispira insulae TaxID=1461337 RepID=A0A3D9HRZ7_9PROT|nr:hypothetical protein [Aestuariispira insulae]RED52185.1 hypothetical protein DFP90_102203 [Aestuariispira insulae]
MSWGDIAKLLSVGATALQAGASIYQARASRKAAKRQASYERKAAGQEAENRRRDLRRRIGLQRASFAAQGIDLEGSPGLLIDETERYGQQDIDDILSMGEMRAGMARRRGRSAAIGGGINAAGSLLGGAFDYYKTFEWDPTD